MKVVYYEPFKDTIDVFRLLEVIIEAVMRHHCLSDSIVSDQGSVFTSKFWSSLYYFFNIKQKLLNAFHPQTDS